MITWLIKWFKSIHFRRVCSNWELKESGKISEYNNYIDYKPHPVESYEYYWIDLPFVLFILILLCAGWNYQAPQNPAGAAKVPHLEFELISDVPIGNGIYKYTLPNKNGYLILVRGGGGEMAVTYIPRDVTWEQKNK